MISELTQFKYTGFKNCWKIVQTEKQRILCSTFLDILKFKQSSRVISHFREVWNVKSEVSLDALSNDVKW